MKNNPQDEKKTRRDFIHITSGVTVATGMAVAGWPLIDQMNPSADVLALATVEVDLEPLQPGQSISVLWRGKPLFIRYRTEEEISEAKDHYDTSGRIRKGPAPTNLEIPPYVFIDENTIKIG